MNCKSNAGENANNNDATNKFYQSLIDLGHGFLDVFNSFGGLVAEAFGLKADPKKSDVKNYFSSMVKKLEDTKKNIDGLPKGESSSEEGKNKESVIGNVVKEVSDLLEKLITAGKEVEKVDFGSDSIGNVVAQGAAAVAADEDSVKGIAKGIKGIVDAAGGKLDNVKAATTETGKDAGKLFGNGGAASIGNIVEQAQAAAAADANSVKGIAKGIKGIVDAAGGGKLDDVKAATTDTNADAGKLFGNGGGASIGNVVEQAQAAAAAADANSVKGIAKGIKEIVDAAGGKLDDVKAATTETNADAGKLFGNGGGASIGNVVEQAQAAAAAADANSVKGIAKGIKEIVDAAGGKLDDVKAATTETNADAGKLFGNGGGASIGNVVEQAQAAAAGDASKAAAAVSGVSG
uniref:variable large family protein n=1 Tax=Borreliella bavariensis TaxID=664662 RepID=UPI001C02541E